MPPEIIHTDVCIIGAGPSGATTSLFLSKMKVHHMIIDAATFPRDKVCGDALDLKVMRVLNQLDNTLVQREIMNNSNFAKSWGASVIISKGRKYNLNIPHGSRSGYPFFFVTKRAYFDNFLVSKINTPYADFCLATRLKTLVRENGRWLISAQRSSGEVHIHANLVVGADGDHSAVLRSLGERKIDRQNYAGALRQYWKGISGLNNNNHLEVYLPKKLPLAYLWIFPLPNGEANVGLGLASDFIAKRSIDLKKLLHQLITEDPALSHRFVNATPLEKPVGWGLPLASQEKQCCGDGYLLVGDAAAMISPTTGEGVGPGMISGYIAAHFIARAVQQKRYDKTMFKNYDREIHKRLQGDIKKYKLLRKLAPILYNQLINVSSATGIAQYYFNSNISKWTSTAGKPIDVQLD